jgi:enoyl-CoA hydratase/carnithine racemase
MSSSEYLLTTEPAFQQLTLISSDGTNRLTSTKVHALTQVLEELASESPQPIILTGNEHFFSVGADLNEIRTLTGASAFEFARIGQHLMNAVANFPAPVIAAVHGYCMGGGLDLALSCTLRVASPKAIFGHRGAALGIMTGWGGTQRLSRLIGKPRALRMFVEAQKLTAVEALGMNLVNAVDADPIAYAAVCAARYSFLH